MDREVVRLNEHRKVHLTLPGNLFFMLAVVKIESPIQKSFFMSQFSMTSKKK